MYIYIYYTFIISSHVIIMYPFLDFVHILRLEGDPVHREFLEETLSLPSPPERFPCVLFDPSHGVMARKGMGQWMHTDTYVYIYIDMYLCDVCMYVYTLM